MSLLYADGKTVPIVGDHVLFSHGDANNPAIVRNARIVSGRGMVRLEIAGWLGLQWYPASDCKLSATPLAPTLASAATVAKVDALADGWKRRGRIIRNPKYPGVAFYAWQECADHSRDKRLARVLRPRNMRKSASVPADVRPLRFAR